MDYTTKIVRKDKKILKNRKLKTESKVCLNCNTKYVGWIRQKFCCSKCRASYGFKNKTEEQKERYKQSSIISFKKRRSERPEAHIYFRVKTSAKKRGLPFDLELDDIEIPEYCPLLNIKLEYTSSGKAKYNTPSVDRIDSSKGYVKGNVWVISNKANIMKQDVSIEMLKTFCKNVLDKLSTDNSSGGKAITEADN